MTDDEFDRILRGKARLLTVLAAALLICAIALGLVLVVALTSIALGAAAVMGWLP